MDVHKPLTDSMDALMARGASLPDVGAKQRRDLERTLTTRCAEAICELTSAIRYPTISRRDIELARAKLDAAYAAACILDPEDDEGDHLNAVERAHKLEQEEIAREERP